MNSTVTASVPMDAIQQVGAPEGSQQNLDVRGLTPGEVEQFRAALERYGNAGAAGPGAPASANTGPNIGERMATRASDLASEMKRDQTHVSKLLEKASSTGDSMHLMKAMLALNDYQLRVQTISKVVSKATTSLDQLTKLN